MDNNEKKCNGTIRYFAIVVFGIIWIMSIATYLGSSNASEEKYFIGDTSKCLLYNGDYLCFYVCDCKWNNNTRVCLGRINGDSDFTSEYCKNEIEEYKHLVRDSKDFWKNSFIGTSIVMAFVLCLAYITYIKEKCDESKNNVTAIDNNGNNIRTSFLSKILPCIKFWSNRNNTQQN
jgi:hypothetical protein